MSDSVGKISLDLELQGDLGKQISESAEKIGAQLKASLQNIGNINFKALADGISYSLKKSIDSSMESIKKTIEKTLNSALAGVTVGAKKIKIPIDFGIPTNSQAVEKDVVSNATPRGPPIPKINTGINVEALKAQIENLTQSLDITNAKIEQQKQKLASLKEAYNNTFNVARKNKLQEQILQTETKINNLVATSDKAGFKLADLDKQFEMLNISAKQATAGVEVVNNKIKETSAAANKSSGQLSKLGRSANNAGNHMHRMHYSLSMVMRQFFTWMVVLPLVMKGFTAMTTFLGQSFMTNTQFASSLNQIKSNLYTAFMPIYQAVLPAINALMAGLSRITAYIASFTSALFGKTYEQSFQAAKGLIAAKTAMGVYGEAAKKAGKDSKSALGALAGFDEINTLNLNKNLAGDRAGDSSGLSKVPQMTMPSVDTSSIDKQMQGLASRLKATLGTIFRPFKTGWDIYGASISSNIQSTVTNIISILRGIGSTIDNVWGSRSQGIVNTFYGLLQTGSMILNNVSKFFRGIWENGGQYCFQKILEFGASIIQLAGKINTKFVQPLISWFADNIQPILESALGGVLKVAGDLFDKFTNFIDWLSSDGKGTLDTIVIVLGSLATAWGLVTLWLNAGSIAAGIWNVIAGIGTGVTSAFGAALAFLTSPITLVILAIGALITAGVLLYKNWDSVSAFLNNTWNNIKTTASNIFNAVVSTIKGAFNGIETWFSSVFTGAWNGVKSAFSSVGSFFSGTWNGVKNSFNSVFNSLKSIASTVWNSIKNTISPVISSIKTSINGIKTTFSNVFNSLKDAVKAPLNNVIRSINNSLGKISISIPSWVPVVGGKTFSIPKIPYLAKGGIIDQPTLAMVGERGKEAVMPLENNTGWISNLAEQISAQINSSNNAASNNQVIDILKQILKVLSEQSGDLIIKIGESEFARIAINAINKRRRQTGVCELII